VRNGNAKAVANTIREYCIPAVDRLSRDTTDFLVIARDMQRVGVRLRSLAEPVVDTISGFAELVVTMLGSAAAKAKEVKFGRNPTLTPHQQREARERIAVGETQRNITRSDNVSQATISRLTE
jgi:DNA invertase Pin-like site-specific DNA recombinase